jgi:3-oxoacyl-[acyl-carrier-protein] synthase-3
MRKAVITGTGHYVPKRVVPNQYFNELLGEDVDTWLRTNVEIYERRWCAEDESTADLCEKAAQRVLEAAGISAADIDLIVVATDTPEYISPSTAAVLQHRLGAKKAGTFDLNTACAGFVTAIDVAAKYIVADDRYQHVLVIGAYAMSKYLNLTDKKTVTLFADGAGGVVLSAQTDTERGFAASELRTEGQYAGWMGIYGGGTHLPLNAERVANKEHLLQFVQKFPKELNPTYWTDMTQQLCQRLGVQPSDIAHFFITQININSIRETLDRLGLPHDRATTIMHHYGYTGSAAIPMALDLAARSGKIKPGDLIMLIGSGGGLAFAAADFRF